tara:strand:+ start:119 stop:313 length:195 start_codon:yes stop_codon:yes gene_type:complete
MGWTVNKRKTTLSHLFLPKEYSGDPYASVFTPHTEAEVLAYLETGWGDWHCGRPAVVILVWQRG